MALIIRPCPTAQCDLCFDASGPLGSVYEIFDDRSIAPRLIFLCAKHANAVRAALPLAIGQSQEQNA